MAWRGIIKVNSYHHVYHIMSTVVGRYRRMLCIIKNDVFLPQSLFMERSRMSWTNWIIRCLTNFTESFYAMLWGIKTRIQPHYIPSSWHPRLFCEGYYLLIQNKSTSRSPANKGVYWNSMQKLNPFFQPFQTKLKNNFVWGTKNLIYFSWIFTAYKTWQWNGSSGIVSLSSFYLSCAAVPPLQEVWEVSLCLFLQMFIVTVVYQC